MPDAHEPTGEDWEAWAAELAGAALDDRERARDTTIRVSDLIDEAAESLERLVARVIRDRDPAPPGRFFDDILGTEQGSRPDPATEFALSVVLGVAAGWLTYARGNGIDPRAALDWISRSLGPDQAAAAHRIGGFVGHPDAPALTISDDPGWLRRDLFPAMIWLAAGVAATAGGGDAYWLRQFDVTGATS